jgi:predicted transposase/invertase (TIGR01784 family)
VAKEPLSPKNDLVFKLLFGEPTRLNILRAFLQAVLDLPREEYGRLVIVDPHLQREYPEDKLGVLDVKIHTTTGKVIDVEIQVEPQSHIWERILFYAARLATEQLKSGVPYKEIKKAVSIIIVDWDITSKDSGHYHHRFRLFDERTGCRFPDLFEINTLELPKLPGEPDGTLLYNWLRLFTARSEEELTMVAKTSPEIAAAVGVIMEVSEDERTRLLAEAREKSRRDEEARREYAYLEGEKKGRQKGRQEGEQKGLQAGERNKARDVARSLLLEKDPVERVAKVTGLSLEEVKSLASELPVNH